MTEDIADRLVDLGKKIDLLEHRLQYSAGVIASIAADGHTDGDVFTGAVEHYRHTRDAYTQAREERNQLLEEI